MPMRIERWLLLCAVLAAFGCSGGDQTCPAAFAQCDGTCTDTQVNPAHCGGCGNVCPAGEFCQGGTCGNPALVALTGCNEGLATCQGDLLTLQGSLQATSASLEVCDAALLSTQGSLSQCAAELGLCDSELLATQGSLSQCSVDLVVSSDNLAGCEAERVAALGALAICGEDLDTARGELTVTQAALLLSAAELAACQSEIGICEGSTCASEPVGHGTDFWFAPPDVTDLHNVPGGEPLYLYLVSKRVGPQPYPPVPNPVTISMPANPGFTPITRDLEIDADGVGIEKKEGDLINLTAFKAALETRPTNTIANTGLRIQAARPITAYYEVANTDNRELFILKGSSALGTTFYIPLHKHAPFANPTTYASPHEAIATFDIVATQNSTVVKIYSPVPIDGHPALQQFTLTLNAGQTYSGGWTGANREQPSTHPSGAVIHASKPIAVSIKDDSIRNPAGSGQDLVGDQLLPVNALGREYIAVKGSLSNNADESVVLVATQNGTELYLDGAASPVATLFAGEYYRVDMDYLTVSANNAVHIRATNPVYAVHYTGFASEMAMSILPPIDGCGGSRHVRLVRPGSETFQVVLIAPTPAINGFVIEGPGTGTITAGSFVVVPGTGGAWSAARIQYNTTQFPVFDPVNPIGKISHFSISHPTQRFHLGTFAGGTTSARYGWLSEYPFPRQGP